METTVLRVLLIITSVCSLSAKHVFVSDPQTWKDAQKYCRNKHTDLSPITSRLEDQVLRKSAGNNQRGWIGLYGDVSSPSGWKWSGGVDATYLNWSSQVQTPFPNPALSAYWTHSGWYPDWSSTKHSFFCLDLIVVEQMKSWEEALEHCRDHHTDLTSLLSETEHLLALTEIWKDNATERVWMGLSYLGDGWLWVNGDRLVHEAWSEEDRDHLCPIEKRCAALTKQGRWESWDCQDQLHFICT